MAFRCDEILRSTIKPYELCECVDFLPSTGSQQCYTSNSMRLRHTHTHTRRLCMRRPRTGDSAHERKKRWSFWKWLYYGQTYTHVRHIQRWTLHSTWNNLIKNRNQFSECNAPVKTDTRRTRENMEYTRCYSCALYLGRARFASIQCECLTAQRGVRGC